MKKKSKKDSKDKGFVWGDWVRSANSTRIEKCCYGFNEDGSIDHWHEDKNGNRIINPEHNDIRAA